LFILSIAEATIYVLVYVDDIIVIGNNFKTITILIDTLNSHFSIKDLRDLHYFLDIKVNSMDQSLYLTQTRYLHTVPERTYMTGAKSCSTPLQAGLQLSKNDGTPLADPQLYRTIVDALQYATITKPGLAFSVNKASQFVAQPTDLHWQAVK
jgi:Reverse transcriptase (RNA-dependent DNA polymerase)